MHDRTQRFQCGTAAVIQRSIVEDDDRGPDREQHPRHVLCPFRAQHADRPSRELVTVAEGAVESPHTPQLGKSGQGGQIVSHARRSKAAGMSLDQIAHLLERDMAGRHRVLQAHIDELDRRMEDMRRSRAMAEHALRCSAHDISTCPRFRAELSDLLAEFPAGSHGSERA
jgi:hypothetical protein